MGTGYTRNDTANNIADGNIINAADLDGEFDAIESAFATDGHTHDGTAAEGGAILVLGPSQEFVVSSTEAKPSGNAGLSLGTDLLQFNNLYIDGTAYIDGLGESMLVDTTSKIQFRDVDLFINSSADGQLDLEADTTIELTAPTVSLTNDLKLKSDAAVLSFGADDEITVTHVADSGLDLKNATGFNLNLQTSDTTIESGNLIGRITFNAPDEASGTDAILVGAAIDAVAEGTFDSTTNSTALVFRTNTSGGAVERMRLSSDGHLEFKQDSKATFGTNADLQIYHDSAASYVSEQGTGPLNILASQLNIYNATETSQLAQFNTVSSKLFHDNVETLATTSTGINVTGEVKGDKLVIDTPSSGAAFEVNLIDNQADNFVVQQGSNKYINITTANTAEKVILGNESTTPELGINYNTPNTFGSGFTGIQTGGTTGTVFSAKSRNYFGSNIYHDGSWKYVGAGLYAPMAVWDANTGDTNFYTTASGAADAGISFIPAITIEQGQDGVVINANAEDRDFTIKSDTNAHGFYFNGENGNIGIGSNVGESSLHIFNNKSFTRNVGKNHSATMIVGNRTTTNNANSFAVSGTTHNTYYPAAYYIDSDYDVVGTNITNFNIRASGVQYNGWQGAMTFFVSNGTGYREIVKYKATDVVFNEQGVDIDFRVEGSTQPHLIFADANNNSVSINTNQSSNALALNVKGFAGYQDFAGYRWTVGNATSVGVNANQVYVAAGGFVAAGAKVGDEIFISGTSNAINTVTAVTDTVLTCTNNWTQSFAGVSCSGYSAVDISAGYNTRLGIRVKADGSVVINDNGQPAQDFRVETDTLANAIFVDSSTNVVNFGSSGGAEKVTIQSGALRIDGGNPSASSINTGLVLAGGMGSPVLGRMFLGDGTGWQFRMSKKNSGSITDYHTFYDSGTVYLNANAYSFSDFRVSSDSFSHALYVDAADDNVGIRTSTPDYALDVNGTSRSSYHIATVLGNLGFDYQNASCYFLFAKREDSQDTQGVKIAGKLILDRGTNSAYPRGGYMEVVIDDDTSVADSTWHAPEAGGYSGTVNTFRLAKVSYNGQKYWAMHIPQGTSYHANSVCFEGYVRNGDLLPNSSGNDIDSDNPLLTVNEAKYPAKFVRSTDNATTYDGYQEFNYDQSDTDFRIRGDDVNPVFFVDGGADSVCFGKSTAGVGTEGCVIFGKTITTTISSGNTYHLYDTANYKFYVNANGGIYNYQSSNVNLSDQREKKNIEALDSQWDVLKRWDLKKFHYKSDDDGDAKKVGVIAQDVQVNHPDLIDDFQNTKDETRLAVKEQQMMWMAIKALQEAQDRIETLEARITALENA